MRRNQERLLGLGISILGALTLSPGLVGQALPDSEAVIAPATTDWTHHQVIFSRPATPEQAARVRKDPRYWQQLRSQLPARLSEARTGDARASGLRLGSNAARNQELKRDWSLDMGSGATVGATNYPAMFSFHGVDANCASAAQPDFVVYGTGLVGSVTQADIVGYDNLYSGCSGPVPTVYWAYNTGGTVTTSPVFSRDGTQVAFVQTDASGHGILVLLK